MFVKYYRSPTQQLSIIFSAKSLIILQVSSGQVLQGKEPLPWSQDVNY